MLTCGNLRGSMYIGNLRLGLLVLGLWVVSCSSAHRQAPSADAGGRGSAPSGDDARRERDREPVAGAKDERGNAGSGGDAEGQGPANVGGESANEHPDSGADANSAVL